MKMFNKGKTSFYGKKNRMIDNKCIEENSCCSLPNTCCSLEQNCNYFISYRVGVYIGGVLQTYLAQNQIQKPYPPNNSETINFNNFIVNRDYRLHLFFNNTGSNPITITNITVGGDFISLLPMPTFPVIVAPLTSELFIITMFSRTIGNKDGKISINNNCENFEYSFLYNIVPGIP